MSNYTKGRAKEYFCIQQLTQEGYLAIRSAGSHSPADVIAFLIEPIPEKPLIRFIQCKAMKYIGKKVIKELQDLCLPLIIQREIWHFQKYKPPKIIII